MAACFSAQGGQVSIADHVILGAELRGLLQKQRCRDRNQRKRHGPEELQRRRTPLPSSRGPQCLHLVASIRRWVSPLLETVKQKMVIIFQSSVCGFSFLKNPWPKKAFPCPSTIQNNMLLFEAVVKKNKLKFWRIGRAATEAYLTKMRAQWQTSQTRFNWFFWYGQMWRY